MTDPLISDDDRELMRQLYASGIGMFPSQIASKFGVTTTDVRNALGLPLSAQGVRWTGRERGACLDLIVAALKDGGQPDPDKICAELERQFGHPFSRHSVSSRIRASTKPLHIGYTRREKVRFVHMVASRPDYPLNEAIRQFKRMTGKVLSAKTAQMWLDNPKLRTPCRK